MRITRGQLRRIIQEVQALEGPADIIDADTGEIYAQSVFEADLALWLAENPEFDIVPEGYAGMSKYDPDAFWVTRGSYGPMGDPARGPAHPRIGGLRTPRRRVRIDSSKISAAEFQWWKDLWAKIDSLGTDDLPEVSVRKWMKEYEKMGGVFNMGEMQQLLTTDPYRVKIMQKLLRKRY